MREGRKIIRLASLKNIIILRREGGRREEEGRYTGHCSVSTESCPHAIPDLQSPGPQHSGSLILGHVGSGGALLRWNGLFTLWNGMETPIVPHHDSVLRYTHLYGQHSSDRKSVV